jgi:4-diphosphocytidyl-2-C-methyl-D-erythritol kinase
VKSIASAAVSSPTPASPRGGLRALRFAPAKLNLTLAVLGRRDDGFHALHSVMVPLGFGDEIEVTVGEEGRGDSLAVEGPAVGPMSENLVLRALTATRAAVQASGAAPAGALPVLAARLTKRIPVAAGLGGGSSDAAATVAVALEAWAAALSADATAELAATLGSDVPFFLAGSAALVTGRGELVEPLPDLKGRAPAVLIVTPVLRVSTAAVFTAYAGGARPATRTSMGVSERLAADLRAGLSGAALIDRADELAAANDLLRAALSVAPSLAVFRAALGRILDRPIGQSGSGPTAWILYPSLSAARRAARLVRLAALDGRLPATADGPPFVATSTILAPWPHANAADAHNGGRSIQKGR